MNIRQFLHMLGAGAVTSLSSMVFCNLPKQRPNIIFFHTDSWDGRVLGCLDVAALNEQLQHRSPGKTRGCVEKYVLFKSSLLSIPLQYVVRKTYFSL